MFPGTLASIYLSIENASAAPLIPTIRMTLGSFEHALSQIFSVFEPERDTSAPALVTLSPPPPPPPNGTVIVSAV